MQTDYIDLIEPTPTLSSKKCKAIALGIKIFLQFTTVLVGLVVWYTYDYFIAIATALLSFIVMGIVLSKIRNSVIPPNQREFQYNDKAIADWYVAREICFDEISNKDLV